MAEPEREKPLLVAPLLLLVLLLATPLLLLLLALPDKGPPGGEVRPLPFPPRLKRPLLQEDDIVAPMASSSPLWGHSRKSSSWSWSCSL